jgi:Mycothiol maleylpyruvate isomerase N-terminal domain
LLRSTRPDASRQGARAGTAVGSRRGPTTTARRPCRARAERAGRRGGRCVGYRRLADLLDQLAPADGSRPTVCPPWGVRLLVAHVLGATKANASPAEMLHRLRRGRPGATVGVDAVSSVQVQKWQHLDPDELRRRFRRALPPAVDRRARWAQLAGAVRLRVAGRGSRASARRSTATCTAAGRRHAAWPPGGVAATPAGHRGRSAEAGSRGGRGPRRRDRRGHPRL